MQPFPGIIENVRVEKPRFPNGPLVPETGPSFREQSQIVHDISDSRDCFPVFDYRADLSDRFRVVRSGDIIVAAPYFGGIDFRQGD